MIGVNENREELVFYSQGNTDTKRRSMMQQSLFRKALFPGKYIQGAGALTELPSLIRLFGGNGVVVASGSSCRRVLPESGLDLDASSISVEPFHGECCETELSRIAEIISSRAARVVVAMGGGKAIDTAKIAADREGLPVIVVPTIASTDAPCSGCAVIYSDRGVFESVAYQKLNPAAVLVDTAVIAKAPARFLVSGMGDALSTWFEARSCERTGSANECGGTGTMAGLCLARLCFDTLLAYGRTARVAVESKVVTPALERIVEANTLLSGIGFESGGLASAHAIHNGFTALEETHSSYHGEKVAFGVLAGLHLTDADPAELNQVYDFCEEVGLPTTLVSLGIDVKERSRLRLVAEKACDPGSSIRKEPGSITPEKVLDALLAADAVGTGRISNPQPAKH
jgi:glycerol dehydrogenase